MKALLLRIGTVLVSWKAWAVFCLGQTWLVVFYIWRADFSPRTYVVDAALAGAGLAFGFVNMWSARKKSAGPDSKHWRDHTMEALAGWRETVEKYGALVDKQHERYMRLIDALVLAEELTRKEPHAHNFIPTCEWCESTTGTPDGESFVHEPDCKWRLFRNFFEEKKENLAS